MQPILRLREVTDPGHDLEATLGAALWVPKPDPGSSPGPILSDPADR
jgi:hypothetical protein